MKRLALCLVLPTMLINIAVRAETSWQRANLLFKAKEFTQARQVYLALADQGGDSSQTLALRVRAAQCLMELGDFATMRQECEALLPRISAINDTTSLQQVKHLLAALPYRQKHWDEAVQTLGQYIIENPGDPQLAFSVSNLAEALESLNRHAAARRVLLDFLAKHPDAPEAAEFRFRAARFLYWRKDYSALRQELETLIALADAEKSKAVLQKARGMLAQIPYQQRQWAEAAETLGRFIAENPDAPNLYESVRMRAAALNKLKRYDEARQGLIEFATKQPTSPDSREARFRAALCLFDKGDYRAFNLESGPLTTLEPDATGYYAAMMRMRMAQTFGRFGYWLEMAQAMERLIPDKALGDNLDWVQIHCGEGYVKAALELAKKGDVAQVQTLREKGRAVLADARARLERQRAAAKDQASGDQARMRILDTYYMDEDYAAIAQVALPFAEESRAPSMAWGKAMTWLGVAKCKIKPPDYAGAIMALDAVIAAGVVDDDLAEHVPSTAAYWRAMVAETQHDAPALKEALSKLQTMPDGPIKQAALARFSGGGK